MPLNRIDITVQDLTALRLVHVSELDDGASAWVTLSDDYFVLHKSSAAAPDGANVVAPISGSPIAGAPGAKWIKAGAGGEVTPFRFISMPTANTSSATLSNLIVVPGGVVINKPGNVLFTFLASIEITPSLSPTVFHGGFFQFLWDGSLLPENGFIEFDYGAATTIFDTISLAVPLRAMVVGTVGTHTLSVQWAVNQPANDRLDAFQDSGSLTIEGK